MREDVRSGGNRISAATWRASLSTLLLAVSWVIGAGGQERATVELMPFLKDFTVCYACHSEREKDTRLKDPARACSNLCRTCHKATEKHHPTDVVLEVAPSSPLALTSRNELACTTCHDLKVNRFDRSPWKGESLFSSLFRRQRQYKTYYLAARNNKGQLCRNCH
jgi:hypothetical protein